MTNNPFVSSSRDNDNKTYNVDSSSVSLELKHKNGSAIKVEDLDEPLQIDIPRENIIAMEQEVYMHDYKQTVYTFQTKAGPIL